MIWSNNFIIKQLSFINLFDENKFYITLGLEFIKDIYAFYFCKFNMLYYINIFFLFNF